MQLPGPTQELLNLFFMGPGNLHLPHFTQRVLRHTHTLNSIAQARVRAMRQHQPDSLLVEGRQARSRRPRRPVSALVFIMREVGLRASMSQAQKEPQVQVTTVFSSWVLISLALFL